MKLYHTLRFVAWPRTLLTCVVAAAAVTPDAFAQSATGGESVNKANAHFSWRSTIGTHYRLDEASHLGTVRGWPHHYLTAYHTDYTDFDHQGLEPTIGRFSGEKRFYNYNGGDRTEIRKVRKAKSDSQVLEDAAEASYDATVYETKTVEKSVQDMEAHVRSAMDARVDIIQGVLGNVKPTRPEFKNFYSNDGKYFKDAIYHAVVHFNTGEFADKPMEIYWQLGNEVNAYNRFHITPLEEAEALDSSTQKIVPNGNPDIARDYVEFYLAPAAEALRAASEEAYGDPDKIKIVSGSVSGIRKGRMREFLDVLLNTTIKGERAPTLAGKKAWEVIDVITIHYAHGDHGILGSIYDQWVATDRVEGLWVTEELGARGAGAYCVAQVSMRYLDFWAQHQDRWTPDAARMIVWGDGRRNHPRAWGQGKEAFELIGPFLQDFPLTRAADEVQPVTNADLEWYMLRADESDDQARYLGYFASYTGARARLRQVMIDGPDGRGVAGVKQATATVIDAASGMHELPVDVQMRGNRAIVSINYEVPVTAAVILKVIVEPMQAKPVANANH